MNYQKPSFTIIIPVFNEASIIEKYLSQFPNQPNQEIIIVDGGSTDNTVKIVQQKGFQVIESKIKKRSYQMNLGAKKAQGNILLFLHGDTILPDNYGNSITNILAQPNTIAGAFRLQIDAKEKSFRLLEKMINFRSIWLSLPYGDQGIFLKKSVFNEVGGFPDLPIMEDFVLIKMLQKKGKIEIADDGVITSARRWQKLGIFKTTLINQLIIAGYYLGIDFDTLAKFYRNQKSTKL